MNHHELAQRLVEALHGLPGPYIVAITSMLPVLEVRGGVIAGLLLGLPAGPTLVYACLGNFLAITPALLFVEPMSRWLYQNRFTNRLFHRAFEHAKRKEAFINKWGVLGLTLFMLPPIPGNGAWTAVIIAIALGLHRGRALGAIYLGIILSGALVALLTYGGITGVEALHPEL